MQKPCHMGGEGQDGSHGQEDIQWELLRTVLRKCEDKLPVLSLVLILTTRVTSCVVNTVVCRVLVLGVGFNQGR